MVVRAYDGTHSNASAYSLRWNGSAWLPFGGAMDPGTGTGVYAISNLQVSSKGTIECLVTEEGLAAAAPATYLMQTDGKAAWSTVAQPTNASALAIDSMNRPLIAYAGTDGARISAFVEMWDPFNTGFWVQIGGAINAVATGKIYTAWAIVLDSTNAPIVGFTEPQSGSTYAYFEKYTPAGGWASIGGPLSFAAQDVGALYMAKDTSNRIIAGITPALAPWGSFVYRSNQGL
jgi:hypothetical protein